MLPNTGFTIEAWVYMVNDSAVDGAGAKRAGILGTSANSINSYFTLLIDGTNTITGSGFILEYAISGIAYSKAVTFTTPMTKNEWHHIAVCSSQEFGTLFFLDGILAGTPQPALPVNLLETINPCRIGVGSNVLIYYRYFNGYIDSIRITKNIARYQENFTVPEREFLSGMTTGTENALILDSIVPN